MPYREESESPPRKELERSPSPVIENDRSTSAGPSKKPRFMTTGSSAMDNQRRQVCPLQFRFISWGYAGARRIELAPLNIFF